MRITDNIAALELRMEMMGRESVIYPALLWDSGGATLVDTGMPGQLEALREEIENAGVEFDEIRRIILTHQDIDHIGGLPEIIGVLGEGVEVLAHGEDRPYIEGERTPIKMSGERMAQMAQSLPEPQRQRLEKVLSSPPSGKVSRTLSDGEVLPIHGGVRVIYTPGHTPGHISLFVEEAGLLIAGDELRVEDGELVGPSETATPDMESARASLGKLTSYPAEYALCYHGGLYGPGAAERIRKLNAGS